MVLLVCRNFLPLLSLFRRFKVLLGLQLGHQPIAEFDVLRSRRIKRQWLERPLLLSVSHLVLSSLLWFGPARVSGAPDVVCADCLKEVDGDVLSRKVQFRASSAVDEAVVASDGTDIEDEPARTLEGRTSM
jgi:hypothetical protein